MFGITNFSAFILAGILLNITPGADTMYILGRSISNGKRAGILSALGTATGLLIHTLLAASGLSVILAQSEMAFLAVKYAGGAYLIYLGIRSLLQKHVPGAEPLPATITKKRSRIYLSGVLTNVLNPKVALFFLAFLPQFVDPAYARHFVSFLVLGVTFTFTGTIWCLLLAVFSSTLSARMKQHTGIKRWLDRITGVVFIALGIRLALSKP